MVEQSSSCHGDLEAEKRNFQVGTRARCSPKGHTPSDVIFQLSHTCYLHHSPKCHHKKNPLRD
jgi:hypothetical protein